MVVKESSTRNNDGLSVGMYVCNNRIGSVGVIINDGIVDDQGHDCVVVSYSFGDETERISDLFLVEHDNL